MCRNIDQIKEVDDDISGSKSHTISPSRVMKENYHPMKILLGHIRMEHKVDKNFNLLRQEFGQIWALPGPFAIAKITYVVSIIVFLFRILLLWRWTFERISLSISAWGLLYYSGHISLCHTFTNLLHQFQSHFVFVCNCEWFAYNCNGCALSKNLFSEMLPWKV